MIQQTIDRLHDLRLRKIAEAYLEQKNRGDCGGLTFDERFQLLVEAEWLDRMERRVKRRLKQAKLKQRTACLEDVDYTSRRGLDRKVIEDLATCHWIRNGRNVILTGATGVGKTWLACAFSNRACREGLSVRYYRVPRLAHELTLARCDGSFLKLLGKLARTDLLILDDWALSPLEGQVQHDLLEIIDDRAGARSTIHHRDKSATNGQVARRHRRSECGRRFARQTGENRRQNRNERRFVARQITGRQRCQRIIDFVRYG